MNGEREKSSLSKTVILSLRNGTGGSDNIDYRTTREKDRSLYLASYRPELYADSRVFREKSTPSRPLTMIRGRDKSLISFDFRPSKEREKSFIVDSRPSTTQHSAVSVYIYAFFYIYAFGKTLIFSKEKLSRYFVESNIMHGS